MSKAKEPKPHRDSDGTPWCDKGCPCFIKGMVGLPDVCDYLAETVSGLCYPAVRAMAKRLAHADAVIERLPKTADGVTAVPEMVVYLLRYGGVDEVAIVELLYRDGVWKVYYDWDWYGLDECYSTREAAEQAREDGK